MTKGTFGSSATLAGSCTVEKRVSHHFPSTSACTHSFVDDSLHGAGEGGGHAEAPVIQDVHGHLEAFAQFAQQAVSWHADVVKVDLGGVRRLDAHFLLWGAAVIKEEENKIKNIA